MPLIDRETAGVCIIAATPFEDRGAVDHASIDRLTDFYLAAGVDAMTVLGVMGEAPKLTPEEGFAVASRFIARSSVPVIVGCSAPSFGAMGALAKHAMDQGAAGVMVAPAPGLKTEAAVLAYYEGVCAAIGEDVPLVFQDYPQLTGVHVSAGTILTLARRHPQMVMLKHEDCPGLGKLSAVREGSGVGETPRLSILCGNGGLYLAQEMQRGADGAMTGFAFPEMLVEVVRRHRAGDVDGAEDVFDAWLPLVRHEQQPGLGLALRKEALRRQGAIASAAVRAPGPRLSAPDRAELTRLVARVGRRLGRELAIAAE